MQSSSDPRRPNKIQRYKPPVNDPSQPQPGDDALPEYMNVLGMIFSMCGLMLRLKWCAWIALLCSCVSYANTRNIDDTKQILSSFMQVSFIFLVIKSRLSVSAVVMSYLQNPTPIIPPWVSLM